MTGAPKFFPVLIPSNFFVKNGFAVAKALGQNSFEGHFLFCKYIKIHRLVHVKNSIDLFPGECPRRFFDSDRDTLHTSFMCHCKDLPHLCACVFFV